MNVQHAQTTDPGSLRGKRIGIVGYGSQGRAHALNLRDSGCDVVVGLRTGGASYVKAIADGWSPVTPADAAKRDVVMMLTPDEETPRIYREQIAPNLHPGAALGFAHGFAVHFNYVQAPPAVSVFMVAPKAPGRLVRSEYEGGRGVPCLIAVAQDPHGEALEIARNWAIGIGAGRAAIIETNFREETETDLFGEQAVLCGGLSALVTAGFETLVDAGYAPEMAYFECLHEMKLIVDLIYERGITGMRDGISNTAKYGDYTRGSRIVTEQTRQAMRQILTEITSGTFAKEWMAECEAGKPRFERFRSEGQRHQIEGVGVELRSYMPWMATPEPPRHESPSPALDASHAMPEVGAFMRD